MNQCLESPDLLSKATSGITVEEKHLIYIELMIMEQVEDWEVGVGKTEQESGKSWFDIYLCKMTIYYYKQNSTENRFIMEVYYISSMDEISKNGVISPWWKNENNCPFSRCCKTLLVRNLPCVLKTWEFKNVWRMQMGRICWQRRAERALAQAQTAVQDSEIFWCTFFTITHIRPHFIC